MLISCFEAPQATRFQPFSDCREASADALQKAVAAAFGIRVRDLRAVSRGEARVALARQCAMYLAHVAWGLNFAEVGRMFGRDRTTVAHACRRIEDRRECAQFDAMLDRLEHAFARQVGV